MLILPSNSRISWSGKSEKLTVHGNGTNDILTQVLLGWVSYKSLMSLELRFWCTYRNLKDELLATVLGLNGVENGRELVTVELHCWRESDIVFF